MRWRGRRSEPERDPVRATTDPADLAIIERAAPYTMTSHQRLQALIDAVRHVVAAGIPGDFAECGVWRGGSVLAMLLTLQDLGVDDRDVHLFDTFTGMTEPTAHDTSPLEAPARATWEAARARGERAWEAVFGAHAFDEASVRATLAATGYPAERLHLVAGRVEDTIPARAPQRLALLRLDTDWYESTAHELRHLYGRLTGGGVLIIDDYGHWDGARRAVDEHFAGLDRAPLLTRIDYTGRLAVKP